jgi:hypothetical protein
MYMRVVAALAALTLSSGCAIHPLPEDVTGVSTYHIVRRIRCEARETVQRAVKDWLAIMARHNDPVAQKLLAQYASHPESIRDFHYDLFKGRQYVQVRSVLKLFYDTGIAYNFDLTMSENNDLTLDANFLKPLTEPRFTLGVAAGAKRRRTNERTFTVTDTFSHLLTQVPDRYCEGFIVEANYYYPISGRIGVDKLVKTFIELTLFARLSGEEAKPGVIGAPTMADKLTFTTAINASANPKVEFAPLNNTFRPLNIALSASADRTDTHQVTVALAIADAGFVELEPFRAFLFSPARSARVAGGRVSASAVVVGRRVTGGGTPSERLAVIAVDQIKSRELQIIPPP